jgi:mannose-6-phosphate isomerase-like protein (cupin superfamily)
MLPINSARAVVSAIRYSARLDRKLCAIREHDMNAKLIAKATVIEAPGNLPKVIEEFIGRVNSGTEALSIARMSSPTGWIEPGQTPEFDEYTVVLRGLLRVTTRTGVIDVAAGQAIISPRGQWVQYSTPGVEGAQYIAVCVPAFSPATVHRDDSAPQ